MSTQANLAPIADQARIVRRARGAFVKSLIEREERSARFVAIRIGLNPSSMSERLRGRSPFLADELEGIARVLRLDPVDFYRQYIAVDTTKAPTPEGEGQLVHPLGLEPRTHWLRDGLPVGRFGEHRPDGATVATPRPVIALRTAVS